MNTSEAERRGRWARRTRRAREIYARIGEAVGGTEVSARAAAALSWSLKMPSGGAEDDIGMPIGGMHPGHAAIAHVRSALMQYRLPTNFELHRGRIERTAGHGASGMSEGTIFVQATLHSVSGARHFIDVPVVVHRGRLLTPAVIVHEGIPRVLTQQTLDGILRRGEFYQPMPERPTMYSPAPEDRRPRPTIPIVNPGMFQFLPRGRIRAALNGTLPASAVGCAVVVRRALDVPVGGTVVRIAAGTKACVEAEEAAHYRVAFPSMGLSLNLPRSAVTLAPA